MRRTFGVVFESALAAGTLSNNNTIYVYCIYLLFFSKAIGHVECEL